MKFGKNLTFYLLFIGVFIGLFWIVLQQGKMLESKRTAGIKDNHVSELTSEDKVSELREKSDKPDTNSKGLLNDFLESLKHPLSILLIQIILIVPFAALLGIIFRRIGQPTVIGEIIAGIILGPSVLGALFPEFSGFVFPASSLSNLSILSQIGLILFMFIIGMELDIRVLKHQAHDAVILSHASIVFPYFLGTLTAYFIFFEFAPPNISFLSFALFMGIAMSITAFPVLARILQERGLTKTPLGILALTCAAADDITAWCLLAIVIAIVKAGSIFSALITILFALLYVVFMLKVLHPILARLGRIYITREYLNRTVVAFIFMVLLISSFMTEVIGIHLLFGAFMAGVIMPYNAHFKRILAEKIEDVSMVLLLPLFFVFTGLRTQIGLINSAYHWLICALIIFVAVLGKLGGSAVAARYVGQSWKNSLSIGILMNTRGLMELVALNIGYEVGVLSPEMFTMLVIMALVTTFMSGPLLGLVTKVFKEKEIDKSLLLRNNVLISFGLPQTGMSLFRLADVMMPHDDGGPVITAMHITPDAETKPNTAEFYEEENFGPLKQHAELSGLTLKTKYKTTGRVDKEIIDESRHGQYGLVLLGGAKSIFKSRNIIGRKVRHILSETESNTGILFNSDMKEIQRILVILNQPEDKELLIYGFRIASGFSASLSFFDNKSIINTIKEEYDHLSANNKNQITVINSDIVLDDGFLKEYDLVIISLQYWEKLNEVSSPAINADIPLLVIRAVNANLDETRNVKIKHDFKRV